MLFRGDILCPNCKRTVTLIRPQSGLFPALRPKTDYLLRCFSDTTVRLRTAGFIINESKFFASGFLKATIKHFLPPDMFEINDLGLGAKTENEALLPSSLRGWGS